MTAPAYLGPWEFLYSWVLLAVDASGRLRAVHGDDDVPLLCMWTDADRAAAALPEGYRLVQSPVRARVAELPDGVGITVDPGPDGLVLDPARAAELRSRTAHFPMDAMISFFEWSPLPAGLGQAIEAAGRSYSFVDAVWAVQYRIDGSPPIGALVYRTTAGREGQESIAAALSAALDSVEAAVTAADVLGVNIVSFADLPPDTPPAFGDLRPAYAS